MSLQQGRQMISVISYIEATWPDNQTPQDLAPASLSSLIFLRSPRIQLQRPTPASPERAELSFASGPL